MNPGLRDALPGEGAAQTPVTLERTITACFAEDQPSVRQITVAFDGYVKHMLRVSGTCLVTVNHNRYSVPAAFAGRAVSMRTTTAVVRIVADGAIVADHARRFRRDQLICDLWHYLPILERKPGALRNGVPFQHRDLLTPIRLVPGKVARCHVRFREVVPNA